jgi:hypothetical protein
MQVERGDFAAPAAEAERKWKREGTDKNGSGRPWTGGSFRSVEAEACIQGMAKVIERVRPQGWVL